MFYDLRLRPKQLSHFFGCLASRLISIKADYNVLETVQPLKLCLTVLQGCVSTVTDRHNRPLTPGKLVSSKGIQFTFDQSNILTSLVEQVLTKQLSLLEVSTDGELLLFYIPDLVSDDGRIIVKIRVIMV